MRTLPDVRTAGKMPSRSYLRMVLSERPSSRAAAPVVSRSEGPSFVSTGLELQPATALRKDQWCLFDPARFSDLRGLPACTGQALRLVPGVPFDEQRSELVRREVVDLETRCPEQFRNLGKVLH